MQSLGVKTVEIICIQDIHHLNRLFSRTRRRKHVRMQIGAVVDWPIFLASRDFDNLEDLGRGVRVDEVSFVVPLGWISP